MHTPIKHSHDIQALPRTLHSRLVVKTKPLWEQGLWNSWHEAEHQCSGNIHRHPKHIHIWNERCNIKRWTSTSLIFSIHMWLLCSCFCYSKGIIILLPFIAMPPIIANPPLTGQYCPTLCSTSFLCGQPCMMYAFTFCRCVSSCVAVWIYSMDMQTGMFTEVLIALMFMLIPEIPWFLFSVWLLWDNQSMMYKCGLGLHLIQILYWCILSIICCNCWDSMATPLLSNATNGLWSVMMHTSLAKQLWWNISYPCRIPKALHSMLL